MRHFHVDVMDVIMGDIPVKVLLYTISYLICAWESYTHNIAAWVAV